MQTPKEKKRSPLGLINQAFPSRCSIENEPFVAAWTDKKSSAARLVMIKIIRMMKRACNRTENVCLLNNTICAGHKDPSGPFAVPAGVRSLRKARFQGILC